MVVVVLGGMMMVLKIATTNGISTGYNHPTDQTGASTYIIYRKKRKKETTVTFSF